jgi:predicted transcriptional regulator
MTLRHASDELDRALDRLVEGRPAVSDPALRPLLLVAEEARAALHLEVSADVAERHLALLSEIDVAPARQRWSRRKKAAVVLLAAALALGTMIETAAASTNALPGELLYPVKRAIEALDLAIHRDPVSRAKLHLEFAQRRLQELNDLLALRQIGQKVDVGAAMRSYTAEVTDLENDVMRGLGRDSSALLAHVEDELNKHLTVLADIRDRTSSPQARDAIERAIERAQTAEQDVQKNQSKDHGKPRGNPSHPQPDRGHSSSSGKSRGR